MARSRGLVLALGALAASSGVAMLTFDIIFAASLPQTSLLLHSRISAIVSSSLSGIDVAILLLIVGRQIRYRNSDHVQDFGHGRRHTYVVAGLATLFGLLAGISSAIMLAITRMQFANIIPSSSIISWNLIISGFSIWAAFIITQTLFTITIIITTRQRKFPEVARPYSQTLESSFPFPQMAEITQPEALPLRQAPERGQTSTDSRTPPPSPRSRSNSESPLSRRSNFSQAIRPITSKTRLIGTSSQRNSHQRPPSIASSRFSTPESDGFDSWDTSTVDPHSRQAVESVSPSHPQSSSGGRFLETIPASPTGSRSPSPGFPLDILEPPKRRERSRSYSPANSPTLLSKSRNVSPTESTHEAHIHPLFRTDSPTPPPSTTPSTSIIAAPNAGQLISDRSSIRSIHRMRSGSLPSSPVTHSASLDSIRKQMERDRDLDRLEEVENERTLTPPIPDFILNGGPRNSIAQYQRKRDSTKKDAMI